MTGVPRGHYQNLSADPLGRLNQVFTMSYVVASLEIVLQHESGTGLLLRLHSYPPNDDREGYWAAPSLQPPVLREIEPFSENKLIIEQIERYVSEDLHGLDDQMVRFAESFGIRGAKLQIVGDTLVEVKPSIQQPDQHSLFATVRYRVKAIDPRSYRNLLDPEGRHGFVVLPLGDDDLSRGPDPDGTGKERRHFLGKPLISGLDNLMGEPSEVSRLISSAIDIRGGQFRRVQSGLIVCADIAGYGAALSVGLNSLLAEHAELRGTYRRRILAALETALVTTGTTQVQSAGDGFVAGYPCSKARKAQANALRKVLDSWTTTLRTIAVDLNPLLMKNSSLGPLGSRVAIAGGSYSWGRVNGLSSFFPAFDGDAIVAAARMEQALRTGMYAAVLEMNNRSTLVMEKGKHYLALQSDLAGAAADIADHLSALGWTQRGRADLMAKEMRIRGALILEWDSIVGARAGMTQSRSANSSPAN